MNNGDNCSTKQALLHFNLLFYPLWLKGCLLLSRSPFCSFYYGCITADLLLDSWFVGIVRLNIYQRVLRR